jgi:hypothetical protein
MKGLFVAIDLAAAAVAAQAQELEEIVVTGQRSQSYEGMPAVTVRKPADFLVQGIRLIDDSRSPDLRRSEIIGTIDGLLKRAAELGNVALSYGEGFLVPIDQSGEAPQIIEDQKRSDTSVVDIDVKVTLTGRDDTKKRLAADNTTLSKGMGGKCDVKVGGPERRIEWERTGIAELTVYIPYSVQISKRSYEH